MLTKKQHQLLTFIDRRLRETGFSPSFDEMKEALGLKSKSGIHRLLTGLEERGFVRRLPHRARALEIIKLPETTHPVETTEAENVFDLRRIAARGKDLPAVSPVLDRPASSVLPLYGKIAAGTPIEALRDHSGQVEVPLAMMRTGAHYALNVEGDSMIEAGILDGDTVIVQTCSIAENGAVVVALVDNAEVTLKRLQRRGASVALEPANRAYETRIFAADRIQIQGRLVGLLRRY